jgi:hypothetical protein
MYTGIYNRENDGTKKIDSAAVSQNYSYLKADVDNNADCSFSFSINGIDFKPLGNKFKAVKGMWIGAKVGVFHINPNITESKGYSDFEWIKFE